ncbi:MAG: HD domain-containing protein [Vicinamibacterales bacterium]
METPMLTRRFTNAVAVAHEIHAGQVKKGGRIPYIAHLLGATSIALHHGADEDEAIAALLHDAIEDAPEDRGAAGVRTLIAEEFGPRVLDIVEGCTDTDERTKPPWLARKRAYVAHVPSLPASTVLVSASDKLHNVSAILSDFHVVGHDVWKRFNPAAGMPGVIGYYRGLVTAYRTTGHHPRLVDELDRVVVALEDAAGHRGVWPPRS